MHVHLLIQFTITANEVLVVGCGTVVAAITATTLRPLPPEPVGPRVPEFRNVRRLDASDVAEYCRKVPLDGHDEPAEMW